MPLSARTGRMDMAISTDAAATATPAPVPSSAWNMMIVSVRHGPE